MRTKQIIGFILLAIGVLLVIFAIHAMWQISQAKGTINDISNFFNNNPTWNPIITFFGGTAEEEVSKYDLPALACLILGLVLTFFGSFMTFGHRPKK